MENRIFHMKRAPRLRSLIAALVLLASLAQLAFSQPPPMAVVSPEVSPDGKVTFRLRMPNAVRRVYLRDLMPKLFTGK